MVERDAAGTRPKSGSSSVGPSGTPRLTTTMVDGPSPVRAWPPETAAAGAAVGVGVSISGALADAAPALGERRRRGASSDSSPAAALAVAVAAREGRCLKMQFLREQRPFAKSRQSGTSAASCENRHVSPCRHTPANAQGFEKERERGWVHGFTSVAEPLAAGLTNCRGGGRGANGGRDPCRKSKVRRRQAKHGCSMGRESELETGGSHSWLMMAETGGRHFWSMPEVDGRSARKSGRRHRVQKVAARLVATAARQPKRARVRRPPMPKPMRAFRTPRTSTLCQQTIVFNKKRERRRSYSEKTAAHLWNSSLSMYRQQR